MGGKRKEAFIETLSIENELNLIKVEDNKRYLDQSLSYRIIKILLIMWLRLLDVVVCRL